MNSLVKVMRHGAAAFSLAMLVSCGGGDRVEPFVPTRLLVFGDEASVLDDSNSPNNGRKYTVNALNATNTALACGGNAIWVQYLSNQFNLVLPQCNPSLIGTNSRNYAVAGATVAGVASQIDTHLATSNFTSTDLVPMMAGANDIYAAYAQFEAGTLSETQARAAAQSAGAALAAQVIRVINAGGKVVLAILPNLGQTPFAIVENQTSLLENLSADFNLQLRTNIPNDGSKIALVETDRVVNLMVTSPGNYSLVNVTTPVCDAIAAPTVNLCTTQTLVAGGGATTYLWADQRQLSAAGHQQLGSLAVTRATNNPF